MMTDATGAELALAEGLGRFDPATLHEASGGEGAVDWRIKSVWPGASIAGRALTARCAVGDNLPVHRAIAAARPGDVLVVDAAGDVAGYLGEVLATSALARGVRGMVIDGGVRDVVGLRRLGFPVWARGLSIRGCIKAAPGTLGEPVVIGGIPVRTGDYVVADDDGVVIVAHEGATGVLAAAQRRADKEAETMARLEQGEVTLDLHGLREGLRRQGIA